MVDIVVDIVVDIMVDIVVDMDTIMECIPDIIIKLLIIEDGARGGIDFVENGVIGVQEEGIGGDKVVIQ